MATPFKHRLLLPVACVFLAATTTYATACTCAVQSTRQRLGNADSVFRGELVGHRFGQAVFRVRERWKGEVGVQFSVDWHEFTPDCRGFAEEDLKIGKDLLVFANRSSLGTYETSVCAGTGSIAESGAALADLGPGQPPLADAPWDVTKKLSLTCIIFAILITIAAFVRDWHRIRHR